MSFLWLIFLKGTNTLVDSLTCEAYTGDMCDRYESRNVTSMYIVPEGITQQKMDHEINNTVYAHAFKYEYCKKYLVYLMCKVKFKRCKGKTCKLCIFLWNTSQPRVRVRVRESSLTRRRESFFLGVNSVLVTFEGIMQVIIY